MARPSMMQKNKLPKDLLVEWAREHENLAKRKRVATVAAASGVILAGFAELALFKSLYVLGALCALALGLIGLSIGIGYSCFVFYLAWTYCSWVRNRGQVRPSALHLLAILGLAACAAVPVASLSLHDRVDLAFWVALGFMSWVNASAAAIGYLAPFLFESR